MPVATHDYDTNHLIRFLKEEFERIITQCGRGSGDSLLSDAQALAIWFLHQEVGISYEEANRRVLDDKSDCGVDFIWEDSESKRILVGQVEYDGRDWTKETASERKATETFAEFRNYLEKDALPQHLHATAATAWRRAKKLVSQDNYVPRYYFVTPKSFSESQRERIRRNSGFQDYDFFIAR